MPETNLTNAVVSDMTNNVDDFSVATQNTDGVLDQKETTFVNDRWSQQLGYFRTIPELNRAITALAIWTAGKGFNTDSATEVLLDNITGWGEESFHQIMLNMIKTKKIGGDAFAEIIRNDSGTLVNLKILDPATMRIVVNRQGIIIRYEQISKVKKPEKKFKPQDIFHITNDRIADEIHGTSIVDVVETTILARNEAMADWRKVLHRNVVPVRIIEADTDDTTKIANLKTQYEEAINKGEVLIVPKGNVEIKDSNPVLQDSLSTIRYYENFFYSAVGIPKVIASSEDFTESSSKIAFLTFEPIYTNEQTLLESDLWNQLAIRVTFNRPPSLSNNLKQDEAKDPSPFQPNDTEAGVGQ